jgi:methylthioribose-1-phosphate isomerase
MLSSLALRFDGAELSILDQEKLPHEESWVRPETVDQMVDTIRSLKVRGAPLIGVSAALFLAKLAASGAPKQQLLDAAEKLHRARPTAVNLAHAIERVRRALLDSPDFADAVIAEAREIFEEDVRLAEAMSYAGASLIRAQESILTYCNTGSLATVGIGTALGVVKRAHAQGKKVHVYACETRPLLQGARLTAWELEKNGIPYTLICDNMAAVLMRQGKIDRVLVGADRIAANGDFANKIGTYNMAVIARHHNIPFHVVAPYTTVDPLAIDGAAIKIEERDGKEVRTALGKWPLSPSTAPVFNPSFDVTPRQLVTSYVLDTGISREFQHHSIIEMGKYLYQEKMCPAKSGNISARLEKNVYAITMSGVRKGDLEPRHILLIDAEGRSLIPGKTPSSDTLLHTMIYQLFPEAGAVVHAHTPYGLALTKLWPEKKVLLTTGYAIHRAFAGIDTHDSTIAVPIFEDNEDTAASSAEIGASLKASKHPLFAFLLRGHGIYVWGQDLDQVRSYIEAFEHLFECEYRLYHRT